MLQADPPAPARGSPLRSSLAASHEKLQSEETTRCRMGGVRNARGPQESPEAAARAPQGPHGARAPQDGPRHPQEVPRGPKKPPRGFKETPKRLPGGLTTTGLYVLRTCTPRSERNQPTFWKLLLSSPCCDTLRGRAPQGAHGEGGHRGRPEARDQRGGRRGLGLWGRGLKRPED